MPVASKVLPTLLTGLASRVIGGLAEKAISKSENGLFLGKQGPGVSQIHLVEGGRLYLSSLFQPEEENYDWLWRKIGGHMHGAPLILGDIPLHGWLL